MPRVPVHHHPCQDCGVKLECGGTWEENYDGFPEVVCREFHQPGGTVNFDFVCEGCERVRAAQAQDDEDAWSGGFAENH
jgi:hypothetical protein